MFAGSSPGADGINEWQEMIYQSSEDTPYPTELERLEIEKLSNKSYAIGSAVCCTYAKLNKIQNEVEGLKLRKWQSFFIVLLLIGVLTDTHFANFRLEFNLGVWISAFAILQLWIITSKASRYAAKIGRIKERLSALDLEWAMIHGCVVNNDTFLLGELRGAVEGDQFYPNSDVFMKWCVKEYDRVFEMVAGAHKLAEKNKSYKSGLPG